MPTRIVLPFAALWVLVSGSAMNAAPATRPMPAAPREAIATLLDAFQTYKVVSFPGGHPDGNAGHAQLQTLIPDARFPGTVNDPL